MFGSELHFAVEVGEVRPGDQRRSRWITDQYIGSLTLRTSLLSISAKSDAVVFACGDMPANDAGARAACADGATATVRATESAARRSRACVSS